MTSVVFHITLWTSLLYAVTVVSTKKAVQVAFFSPRDTYDNSNVSTSIPGLANALYDIDKYGLLSEHELNITWYDSQCSGSESVGKAAGAILSGQVDVIIGPACSQAARPVAELATFYNIPMLTWQQSNNDNKNKYKTLARFFGHQETIGKYVASGFEYLNWKRAVVITDELRLENLAAKLVIELEKAKITISRTVVVNENFTQQEINNALEGLRNYGRVFILVVPFNQLMSYMLGAYDLNMAGGDYAFVAVEQTITEYTTTELWKAGDGRDEDAKVAMESLIYMSNADLLNPAVNGTLFKDFSDTGVLRASSWKWKDIFPSPARIADVYSPYLYDTMLVYATVINKSMELSRDIKNGTWIMEQLRLHNFGEGYRKIVMNANADREPTVWVVDLSRRGLMEAAAIVYPTIVNGSIVHVTEKLSQIYWPLGHPPPDTPKCGFHGEKCGLIIWLQILIVVLVLVGVLMLLVIPISAFLYKKRSVEKSLSSTLWNVIYEDIDYSFSGQQTGSRGYSLSVASLPGAFCCIASPSGRPALYKGSVVSVCHCDRKPVNVTDPIRIQLSKMRELHHSNVNAFLGACLSGPVCALWQYCSKGTLTHVLHNSNMKLDYHFKISLITDIMRGMEYLHASPIGTHGNLTSCSIVVDARWCAKVTSFGLCWLTLESRDFEKNVRDDKCGALFWTSPELLRMTNPPPVGTRAGDVYSFGIIFKQILTKTDPYEEYEELSDRQIITKVRSPEGTEPFRPQLTKAKEQLLEAQNDSTTDAILGTVRSCWHEDPHQRPSFKYLVKASHQLLKGAPSNLMDNMVQMLEKYANNLEEIVEQRTQELVEEKKKTDKLLYMMLPESVAEALKRGKEVQAESFDQVTIYFSDIVGFTDIASSSTPFEIVKLLNALYTLFDDIITRHDVYKVETIGDAYMLVSGLPKRNGSLHVKEIANCAIELRTAVAEKFVVPHKPELKLQIRIGLHTGSCVAGVVGLAMPRYCLFGDTVNTASRMESNGEAMKIHMSAVTAEALSAMNPLYKIEPRGEISIKGKGVMRTYWLEDFPSNADN